MGSAPGSRGCASPCRARCSAARSWLLELRLSRGWRAGSGRTTGSRPSPGSPRSAGRARPPHPAVSPGSAASPSAAALCASGSMVSSTLPPLGCSLPTRSITRLTNSRESLPERIAFSVCSIAAGAVGAGEEPGHRCVELGVGCTCADVLEAVVATRRCARRLSPPTRIGPRSREHSSSRTRLLSACGVELAGLEHRDVVDVDQQRQEQQQAADGEGADGPVHLSFTTWVSSSADGRWRSGTGWRAWSLIRSSRATMIQLAISDEPP